MNTFTTATIFIIFALHDFGMSSQEKQSIIARQVSLTQSQISCITDAVTTQLDGPSNTECRSVAARLGFLYDSDDVLGSLSQRLDSFPEFCRSGCGQTLINIWGACNAYDDVENVANLLIRMCASDGGRTCYSNFIELFQYLGDGETCYNSLGPAGTCSSQCSNTLADGAQRYGCCVNVPIDYEDTLSDIENEVNILFAACGVDRPDRCTNSPLSPPSSASHTVAVAVNVGIIAMLVAWQLI